MLLVILRSNPIEYLFVNVFSTKNKSKQALKTSINYDDDDDDDD